MREEQYRRLVARAQAIDEEEAFEAARSMAEALGVKGPDMEDFWREATDGVSHQETGGGAGG